MGMNKTKDIISIALLFLHDIVGRWEGRNAYGYEKSKSEIRLNMIL